jgi:hypothetical protein
VIAEPLNDRGCLGRLEALAAQATARPDIQALAAAFPTTRALRGWIRGLAQRDDQGDLADGPRVACDVSQRARVPAADPNCVERALLYLACAELIDPAPTRRLATLALSVGRHTLPVEDGQAVILDPRAPRVEIDSELWGVRNAVEKSIPPGSDEGQLLDWIADLAIAPATSTHGELGRRRVGNARAVMSRVARGEPLSALRRITVRRDVAYTLAQAAVSAALLGPAAPWGVEVARSALGMLGL